MLSLTGLEIEKLLKQSGMPDRCISGCVGRKGNGRIIIEDLPFDGYFFTGSYKTGKYIYEKCASKMVPCQLEMGGKDPLYVANDVAEYKTGGRRQRRTVHFIITDRVVVQLNVFMCMKQFMMNM